jgi:general secretion pathway protein F
MPVFNYQGETASGTATQGTVTVDSPRQARDQLRGRGISVRRLVDNSTKQGSGFSLWFNRRGLQAQWTSACQELAMLLHAGIPLLDGLDTISKQQAGAFRVILMNVRDRVAAGSSLAEALSERPEIFDPASVRLVEVGENAGNLEMVLEHLADFRLRMADSKDEVLSTLIYPAFLLTFGTGASIFLMTGVMPALLESLSDTLPVLPWPTRVVKTASDFLVSYGWLLILTLILVVFLFLTYIRSDRGQLVWHRFLLRLPILGPMMVKQGVARISMIISTLLRSGIVLTSAFELAAKSTTNRVLKDALTECGKRMGAGENVAEALDRAAVFPPLAIRVFAVGQESGRLEEMLERLNKDYERQVTTLSKRFTALLEPVMILLLAIFVGFLLVATILPILSASDIAS